MTSRYRPVSPPGRRLVPPERSSTGHVGYSYDPYQSRSARETYVTPRTSGDRVIPISSETYVNGVLLSNGWSNASYDPYDTHRRRSTLTDDIEPPYWKSTPSSATGSSSYLRPAVIHNAAETPSSNLSRLPPKNDRDYYVTSAKSGSKHEHKRVYSIDDGRPARLIGETDRDGRKRDDYERGIQTTSGGPSRGYHLSGPVGKQSDGERNDGYEYTDPRGMYRDTEPRWRPRRGSVDAASSRERPTSMIEGFGPKSSRKELGPPPTTRGLDKLNTGISRNGSLRDPVRSPMRYRDKNYGSYSEDDMYAIPPRMPPARQHPAAYDDFREPYSPRVDDYEYNERRDPGMSSRRFEDTDVASRGFGIRPDIDDTIRRDEISDRRSVYPTEPVAAASARRDYLPDTFRDEPRRDQDWREQERARDRERDSVRGWDRNFVPERERQVVSERERQIPREREKDYDDDRKPRDRDYQRDHERDVNYEDDRRTRDKPKERNHDQDRRNLRSDDRRPKEEHHHGAEVLGALAAGTAAYGAREVYDRHKRDKPQDSENAQEADRRDRKDRKTRSPERDEFGERLNRERPRDAEDINRKARSPERSGARDLSVHDQPREAEDTNDRDRKDHKASSSNSAEPREMLHHEVAQEVTDVSERGVDRNRDSKQRKALSPAEGEVRKRNYVEKDEPMDKFDRLGPQPVGSVDPDEEYRRRVQMEMQSAKQRRPKAADIDEDSDKERRRRARDERPSPGREEMSEQREPHGEDVNRRDERHSVPVDNDDSMALAPYEGQHESILAEPLMGEPAEIAETKESRIRIVEPPREKELPKGILRKPTQKFPEDLNPIREGVAPLKDATKKGIPVGARWTKIDRRLVNPEALDEVKERYEERQDCVIVLRVLTKEDIQKFADRTKEIRGMIQSEPNTRRVLASNILHLLVLTAIQDERYDREHRDGRHHKQRDHDAADDSDDTDAEKDKTR